jgi:hypothetical protein
MATSYFHGCSEYGTAAGMTLRPADIVSVNREGSVVHYRGDNSGEEGRGMRVDREVLFLQNRRIAISIYRHYSYIMEEKRRNGNPKY